jgi:hypothetical protein
VFKSSGHLRLGRGNRPGAVTVIAAPVIRSYRRRAIIAFFVTAGVVGLLSATVASHYMHPILGFILGAFIGVACGLVVGLFIVTWPVLRVFWYWLPEIALGLGLVYGWQALMQTTSLPLSLAVVTVVAGVSAAVGPIRRRIVASAWCLIVRHRLRVCFAEFIVSNRDDSRPLILWARPTPAGERVWVWLRPGLSLRDLEAEGTVQRIAVTCWANEVRVVRASRRNAALIRVDITRREPLADTITSPLPTLVPAGVPANAPVSPSMPPLGLDLPDVPDDPATVIALDSPRATRRSRSPDTTAFSASDSATTYRSDNADYA